MHAAGSNAPVAREALRVTNVLTEQQALELVAYLLSAAEITLFEPDLYGPFRLIDAASRLAGYVIENHPEAAPIFAQLRDEIDQKKGWMMWDPPGFRSFVASLPAIVAHQIDQALVE